MTSTPGSKRSNVAAFLKEFIAVLAKGKDLPTLPRVVLEVRAALDDDLVSDTEIATIIEKDPPLASRLLRLANSAAFTRGHPVGEVRGAVQMLGMRQISTLCLALSVVDSFSRGSGTLGLKPFWSHSSAVAKMVQELSIQLDCTPIPREELYVGGLLHDIGLLIMDQYFPDRLRECADRAIGGTELLWEAESSLLGTDHGEVGGMLLGRWSLPEPIAAMVAAHHHPESCPDEYRDAAWLVNTAERICGGLGPKIEIERIDETVAANTIDAMRSADFDIDDIVAGSSSSDIANGA